MRRICKRHNLLLYRSRRQGLLVLLRHALRSDHSMYSRHKSRGDTSRKHLSVLPKLTMHCSSKVKGFDAKHASSKAKRTFGVSILVGGAQLQVTRHAQHKCNSRQLQVRCAEAFFLVI